MPTDVVSGQVSFDPLSRNVPELSVPAVEVHPEDPDRAPVVSGEIGCLPASTARAGPLDVSFGDGPSIQVDSAYEADAAALQAASIGGTRAADAADAAQEVSGTERPTAPGGVVMTEEITPTQPLRYAAAQAVARASGATAREPAGVASQDGIPQAEMEPVSGDADLPVYTVDLHERAGAARAADVTAGTVVVSGVASEGEAGQPAAPESRVADPSTKLADLCQVGGGHEAAPAESAPVAGEAQLVSPFPLASDLVSKSTRTTGSGGYSIPGATDGPSVRLFRLSGFVPIPAKGSAAKPAETEGARTDPASQAPLAQAPAAEGPATRVSGSTAADTVGDGSVGQSTAAGTVGTDFGAPEPGVQVATGQGTSAAAGELEASGSPVPEASVSASSSIVVDESLLALSQDVDSAAAPVAAEDPGPPTALEETQRPAAAAPGGAENASLPPRAARDAALPSSPSSLRSEAPVVSSAFREAVRFELAETSNAAAPGTAVPPRSASGDAARTEDYVAGHAPPGPSAEPTGRQPEQGSGASGAAFSDLEMAFFEQDLQKVEEVDTFEDLFQDLPEPAGPWAKLFGRGKTGRTGAKGDGKPVKRPRPPGKQK